MKGFKGSISTLILISLVFKVFGEDTQDCIVTVTTEPAQYNTETPTIISIINVTDSPLDNGMVIKDIGKETFIQHSDSFEKPKEYVEPSSVPIVFPDNHKNDTPIYYYEETEVPVPVPLNLTNQYEKQYQAYYEQKNLYNSKPIKFEQNTYKNFFIPQSFDYNINENVKVEHTNPPVKPFPYIFENNNLQETWYSNPAYGYLEPPKHPEKFNNEENGVAYLAFPYKGPIEQDAHSFQHHYHHHHHQDHHHQDYHSNRGAAKNTKPTTSWKKIAQLATALVPLGLLLATLTPSIFYVDPLPARVVKRRSEKSDEWKFKEEDVLDLMRRYGIDPRSSPECEDRIICELAINGNYSSANSIEKGIWYLANKTPSDVAEKTGVTDLFEAIKAGNCASFKCEMKTTDVKRKIRKKNLTD